MNNRFAASAIAVIAVVSGLVSIGVLVKLTSEQWAAWIQAVGSIGAILASVAIVQYQRRKELQTVAAEERAVSRRKLNAIRAMLIDVAAQCHETAAKVNREHTTWELEAEHLEGARAMLTALPVFEIPHSGLVYRISKICVKLQAAAKVARAMETPREKRVRDAVAGIIMVPHDLCLEAIVEVTDLLVSCVGKHEAEQDFATFDRLQDNARRAKTVMEQLRKTPHRNGVSPEDQVANPKAP
ncbi:hypothetical protein [Paraburkholderia atlantica]|uniref:hypothetical protein n=1 Tax=Paraburkholderia atlantica TaxID=2654982 RepID=UPI003D1CB890